MIAISYRREDSLPIAGRLYDRLQAKFGKHNVFMDFDSIPPGVDFRERIRHTIERSNLVIAVIGPHWLGEQSDGSRRIDDPTDFVRLEIDYALKGGVPVIPLLVNSTLMPKPEKLPSDIQALAFRNALPLDSGMDFHSHAERLINSISKIANARARPGNLRSRIAVWSTIAVIAGAGVLLFQGYHGWPRVNEPASKPITRADVDKVSEGMSKKEVQSILGPPTEIDNKDFVVMIKTTYTYRQGKDTVTIVFKDDKVTAKESTLLLEAPATTSATPQLAETKQDVAPPTETATSVQSRAGKTIPAPPPKPKKLFAGTWEGTQNPFDRNGKALPGFKNTFTVNETETDITMAQGGSRKGGIKNGARTLSFTIGSGKVAVHDVIVVSEDGKTATYTEDAMGYTTYRGTFHKKN